MPQREKELPVITGSAAAVPPPRMAAEGGAEALAVAYVDGLDGAERKVLLHHIALAWPEVVEAGAGLVAQWRAESAEHRRPRVGRCHCWPQTGQRRWLFRDRLPGSPVYLSYLPAGRAPGSCH